MTWRSISIDSGRFAHYSVNDSGQVRTRHGRVLKGGLTKNGYLQFYLYDRHGECKAFYSHQLVAHEFIGPRPDGLEVNHLDGVKANNTPSNLEYCTSSENKKHAFATGLVDLKGEKHPLALLDDDKVRQIRQLYKTGRWFQRELGAMFGVQYSTINSVLCGRTWSHVQ